MNLVGNLLIAPPAIKGGFWEKTVIVVSEHHHQGSIGLVLNKRSNFTIAEFGNQLNIPLNIPGYVYIGGPVNPQSLTLLHSGEWHCSNTMRLNNGLCISSAEDILPKLSGGDRPIYWRMFLGLAGWGPNQLLNEINGVHPFSHKNSWCHATSNFDLIFEKDNKEQWAKALDKSAEEFAQNMLA